MTCRGRASSAERRFISTSGGHPSPDYPLAASVSARTHWNAQTGSLNHMLKSEGSAPEPGAAERPRSFSGRAHVANAMAAAQDDVTAN